MRFTPAITYDRYGQPLDVLKLDALPYLPLNEGEVRLKLLAAPIHPSDFGMINGSYGRLAQLPATAGREGVGEIVEAAKGVKGWKVGMRAAFLPESNGTWQEMIIVKAKELVPVPQSIHLLQAAQSLINPPTALCLLSQFVALQPGDWLIQNGAHSALGQAIIQIAKWKGYHTVNVVNDLSQSAYLTNLGADVVVAEGSFFWRDLPNITQGAPMRLALNAIGGPSAITLIRCLAYGGTMVTFGGMSAEMIKFPTKAFIFNDTRLVGFWWDHYRRNQPHEGIQSLYQTVFELLEKEILKLPVEKVYPLDLFDAAILHAGQRGRKGKVFLTSSL